MNALPHKPHNMERRPQGKIQKFDFAVAKSSHAESEFEKYRILQDRNFESDFEQMIKQLPNSETKS